MDIRMQSRALMLLTRLHISGSVNAHQIPFFPQKTVIPVASPVTEEPAAPEEVGLRSADLDNFYTELERHRDVSLHAIGVMRDGKVVSLAAAPGYSTEIRHQTHSMCKTVTGLCIGILEGEGLLDIDTPAFRLVGEGIPALLSPRMRSITVRHLLTMTAGVVFNEMGAVTETDWIRSYFESSVAFPPGSRFAYNSMNSYILSVIVERITGKTLSSFAEERIFAPLGIKPTLWEACPFGHTKGGWGLFLSIADMLKIGEMIRNHGTYGGKVIVPREWIREMTKVHIAAPARIGAFDYGYHIWVARDRGSILCNGMLGQNVWIHPKNRMVVAMTASNCELFQTGSTMRTMLSCLGVPMEEAGPLPADEEALAALRAHEACLLSGHSWTHPTEVNERGRDGGIPAERWDMLAEKPYLAEKNNCGILPLFNAMVQNNLPAGIRRISLSRRGEERALTVIEGGESYRLRVGFHSYRETVLSIRGESYIVRCRAEFCDDTDGEPILKLEILFPELGCSRRLRIYYTDEEPYLVLSEQPGRRLLDDLVDLFDFLPRAKLIGGILRSQLEKEYVAYRVRMAYEPRIYLGHGKAPAPHATAVDGEALLHLDQLTKKKKRGLPFIKK